MHCSNNHGQQNFLGLNNQEREQPQLSNRRDTGYAIEIVEIQVDNYICMGQGP